MRNLSDEALKAIFSQDTDSIFYLLLDIDPNTEGYQVVRIYNSNETENGEPRIITSGGEQYVACPFQINLPGEGIDTSTEITLTIVNVDRSITDVIRELHKPFNITMKLVLGEHPDYIEAGPWNMKLTNITGNSLTIEGSITTDRFLDEPFPKLKFDASTFPGLF